MEKKGKNTTKKQGNPRMEKKEQGKPQKSMERKGRVEGALSQNEVGLKSFVFQLVTQILRRAKSRESYRRFASESYRSDSNH